MIDVSFNKNPEERIVLINPEIFIPSKLAKVATQKATRITERSRCSSAVKAST